MPGTRMSRAGPAVSATGPGSSVLAVAYGPEGYSRADAQEREVAEYLDDQHDPAVSDLAAMSPKPTVVKTVTLKYRASVRVSAG
jgi:hypothetical protein